MTDRVKVTTTQTGTGDIDFSLATAETGFTTPKYTGTIDKDVSFVIEEGSNYEISKGKLTIGANTSNYYQTNTVANGSQTRSDNMTFKDDGTRFWLVDGSIIKQWSLSTAWDVTTASYDGSKSVPSNKDSGLLWNDDGTVFWALGADMAEYTCTTAFDITTASASYTTRDTGTASNIYGGTFNDDGTKLYLVYIANIYSWDLSTAYDVSTRSQNNPDATQALPEGVLSTSRYFHYIAWNSDGTVLYAYNRTSMAIDAFYASTPYDITTLTWHHYEYLNRDITEADSSVDGRIYNTCYSAHYRQETGQVFFQGTTYINGASAQYAITEYDAHENITRNLIHSSTGSKIPLTSNSTLFITKVDEDFFPQASNGAGSIAIGEGAGGGTADYQVALGNQAGEVNNNNNGVYIGYASGYTNNNVDNVMIGRSAGGTNVTGQRNVHIGAYSANGSNHDFSVNIGYYAANYFTSGSKDLSVSIGYNSTNDSYGGYNTAVGADAMSDGSQASSVAIGYDALGRSSASAAYYNTCVGVNAGNNIYSGDYNVLLGYNVDVGSTAHTNSIVIGANVNTAASNEITLGNTSITSLRCAVTTITALSDERDKTDIQDIPYGLDFINDLRPVQFTWNRRDGTWGTKKDIGFIAQDLVDVELDHASSSRTRLVNDNDPTHLHADYFRTYPILVKAVQELSEKCDALEARIATLEGA